MLSLEDSTHNPAPGNEFAQWFETESEKHNGRTLQEGRPEHYIPYPELHSYWTKAKIIAVLRAYDPPLPYNAEIIRSTYLRAFAAMVYTSTVRQLLGHTLASNLYDSKWPLNNFPKHHWPESPENRRLFSEIVEDQWPFFPLYFDPSQLNRCTLHKSHILPIYSCEMLKPYDPERPIYKFHIVEHYNSFRRVGTKGTG
jgi:hypothetical protein